MSALTVTSVTSVIVDIPLRRPHKFKSMVATHQSCVIVQIRTRDDLIGIGEGVVAGGPWWGGESVETIQTMIERYLGPALIGRDASRIGLAMDALNTVAAANPAAKAAIEMALFDLCGKASGIPAHRLLGGAYHSSLPVTWALGAEDAHTVLSEALGKLDAGLHTSFKLKMGAIEPGVDTERVATIADVLAEKASVRVDLNGAWDERTAARWLPALQDAGIDLVEQPVDGHAIDAMRRLTAALTIPVMADESLSDINDVLRIYRSEAADVLSLKIPKLGGLLPTTRTAAVATAAGLGCHGGTVIESSIGTAAAAHAFATIGDLAHGTELFGPLLLLEDVVTEPLRYDGGHLEIPTKPGLGVELDDDKVRAFARR